MEKLSSNIAHTHCTFTRAASLPGHVSTSHTRSSAHRSDSWFSSAPSALTYAPHCSSEGRGGQGRHGGRPAAPRAEQAECSGRAPFASAPERCPAEPEPAAALRAARAFPASPHHPARPGDRRASPPPPFEQPLPDVPVLQAREGFLGQGAKREARGTPPLPGRHPSAAPRRLPWRRRRAGCAAARSRRGARPRNERSAARLSALLLTGFLSVFATNPPS